VNPAGGKLPKAVALLPAWNAEGFIGPVLDSLAVQTYANFEVLISDDASTDRTPEICAAFAARHANFRLIRQPRNLGWIGNVNALLRAAEGDYFFFAFHDDRPLPSYVERLVAALEARPDAALAFADMIRRFPPGDVMTDDVQAYLYLEGVAARAERGVRVARKCGRQGGRRPAPPYRRRVRRRLALAAPPGAHRRVRARARTADREGLSRRQRLRQMEAHPAAAPRRADRLHVRDAAGEAVVGGGAGGPARAAVLCGPAAMVAPPPRRAPAPGDAARPVLETSPHASASADCSIADCAASQVSSAAAIFFFTSPSFTCSAMRSLVGPL
jgi:hypothetical protein